jgi:hypothetical protein
VWITATVDVPDLRSKIAAILGSEFPAASEKTPGNS